MESSPQAFQALLRITEQRLTAYQESAAKRERRVITLRGPEDLAAAMDLPRWIAEGGMDEKAFDAFLEQYLDLTTCLHHPGYIGHQVAPPMSGASIADAVNGVTNNGMAVHEMGPPAVALELEVLRWMCGHIGLPEGCGGVLTHGGSLANLTALLAARAAVAPDAWMEGVPQNLVLVAPDTSHYSVARSAGILGLGAKAVRPVATEIDGTMIPTALEEVLDACTAKGEQVMAVVANASNTTTGALDDLESLGRICNDRKVWFHVDGAHGASALLSAKHRGALQGIERADSVIWDAHKMLHTSALCAAVLVRRECDLAAAFHQDASYLGNADRNKGPDLFHRAFECTKVPLGLKVFLNLALHGEQSMADRIDHVYAQAKVAAQVFREAGFEVPFEPQTNILLFRVGGEDLEQAALREQLMEDGNFYITAAKHRGRDYLRLTVIQPSTTTRDFISLTRQLLLAANLPTTA